MQEKEAVELLKTKLPEYVQSITHRSRKAGENMYECPLCGSGLGEHGTGAFSIKDGTNWKCFSCGGYGDIFDLIGKVERIEGYDSQLQRAGEIFGVEIERGFRQEKAEEVFRPLKDREDQNQDPEPEEDFTDFFREAAQHLEETPYHRGISLETLRRFNVGYAPEWRSPKATERAPLTPRLIIPTSANSYIARDTRENLTEEQKRYSKMKAGKMRIFNGQVLRTAKKPIIIVEGEIDALSVIDVGGEAIGLGSTERVRALIELLKVSRPSVPLILSLDNDQAGKEATEKLIAGLEALKIPYYCHNIAGDYKDPNAALMANREALEAEIRIAENMEQEAEEARKKKYLENSAAYCLQSFVDSIGESIDRPCIPTGFMSLDAILEGGLYDGLYIIGAISSLGKTTLIMQIADQIAQSGQDVLIFSLEMSRAEIMAKSISRHTLQRSERERVPGSNAKTIRGIMSGQRYEKYSPAEWELIKGAMMDYGSYADHIYISEGIGNIGAQEIRETVAEHLSFTGQTPVVIIDYLQILAPYSEKATDKQNTDKAVMELKRISRDYKTPVIGISSFNRANYSTAVTMEAFKESGAIEYSSDVLIGLQLAGVGKKDFDVNKAKQKDPREIELKILKNRNGRTGETVPLNYYAMFNMFKDPTKEQEEIKEIKRKEVNIDFSELDKLKVQCFRPIADDLEPGTEE